MNLLEEKKDFFVRLKMWFVRHLKIILISTGIVIICTGATIACLVVFLKKPAVDNAPIPEVQLPKVEPIKYYSPLTGNLVADEATANRPVTGMMIENSPEARPQSGLKNSGVVFEAICEGGITRFLVLYQSERPQLIGPVRSVRMYYIDWAAAFDASIGHVGGNADALIEIRNGNHRDIDQFFNADYYWRSEDRYAPHNVYTSFDNLDALNAEKGYTSSIFTGFSRVVGAPSATPNATSIDVQISSYLFNSSYIYDATTNTYARFQAGEAHLDREDGQITPSAVVVMRVDESTIASEEGSEEGIGTIGSGSVVIFQNGIATEGTWSKASQTSQIKFTDALGVDIPLVNGQTWVVAVPNSDGSVTWQ